MLFARNSTYADGLANICRRCAVKRTQAWRVQKAAKVAVLFWWFILIVNGHPQTPPEGPFLDQGQCEFIQAQVLPPSYELNPSIKASQCWTDVLEPTLRK